ncbi:MAG: nicotinate (nicotinamide) nucleotide adenylyltransferase [Gammaproteobacteria bacterium]|nr:nicotinate (nicotinamide) nucleotide adenylyltransferase [Gammaproteobacteria bacterium]MBT8151837.1 nicotinate (nicotinamide) nucleotide adenylyltransferase [Gammaproteobacteria bacterium]NNM11704.1 nicotinate (nicotinamide) nucleotide adenylyltransferase [Pseudomonadales bacterium]RZV53957.1 MAG: nicotinate (nicotinamide) nucleotide adenylyltransferase [Pseudomonadales bacterium]
MQRIGILGGSFDPVHRGHLGSAKELLAALGLDRLMLVPVAQHAFGKQAAASPAQRLAMLELATADVPGLSVDDIELQRSGPSYSIDTVAHYRDLFGPGAILCFIVGSDALPDLPRWHRWQDFPALTNFVVMQRAEDNFGNAQAKQAQASRAQSRGAAPKAQDICEGFEVIENNFNKPCGQLLQLQLSRLPFSSTTLRRLLGNAPNRLEGAQYEQHEHAKQYLSDALPPAVLDYINRYGLYQ